MPPGQRATWLDSAGSRAPRENHGIGALAVDEESMAAGNERAHRRAGADVRQAVEQRVDQGLHAALERREEAIARPARLHRARPGQAAQHAAVLAFERE